ncbi:hypothetical protein BGW38_009479 [Lunasporangiospora selenospora]|uniref:Uncharacterized protein n=1 Tax=Lunasporangiospora selenospora TaxID=979761 RepID=A0A9P6KHW5_9FUNG|nr:hypothetical protein BGW38_009479 [Lunasporangiospora selenospora]
MELVQDDIELEEQITDEPDGPRMTRLRGILDKSLIETLKACNYKALQECFPLLAAVQPDELHQAHERVSEFLKIEVNNEFSQIIEERNVIFKLNALDRLIADAKNKGRTAGTWTMLDLSPDAAVRARTVPTKEAEIERLKAEIHKVQLENRKLGNSLNQSKAQQADLKIELLESYDNFIKMLSSTTPTSSASDSSASTAAPVINTDDEAVKALIQAAAAVQQHHPALAALNLNPNDPNNPLAHSAASTIATLPATTLSQAVAVDLLQRLMPAGVIAHAAAGSGLPISSASLLSIPTVSTNVSVVTASVAMTIASPVSVAPVTTPVPTSAPALTSAAAGSKSTASTSSTTGRTTSSTSTKASSASSGSSSSTTTTKAFSTKRFNPDDIFCLGCCRNLSVEHYTCPTTNRLFKSCNACRQKSRINSKKAPKPSAVPTRESISMEQFVQKLKDLEATQEETTLDVMVRQEGSVDMDAETLKTRGAQIAAQVYEATGYWFSHSRTNDETQSKTRLKIYGCSQREDRRAPPAPKTQSRKRNRPSIKSYFPCKGNLTMTFYHNQNQVRILYSHKRHAKYDNRKCPDHVRAFVKENLGMAPRLLYETLMTNNPRLGITQAQVRYWSHYFKKLGPSSAESPASGSDEPNHSNSSSVTPEPEDCDMKEAAVSASDSTLKQESQDPATQQQQQATSTAPQPHTEQQQQVEHLLSSAAAGSLHSLQQNLVGGSIAISLPLSTGIDASPLPPSIVQSVLAGDGKGLLQLPAELASLQSAAPTVSADTVAQQVTEFMKENDQQQHLEHLQSLQEQQQAKPGANSH